MGGGGALHGEIKATLSTSEGIDKLDWQLRELAAPFGPSGVSFSQVQRRFACSGFSADVPVVHVTAPLSLFVKPALRAGRAGRNHDWLQPQRRAPEFHHHRPPGDAAGERHAVVRFADEVRVRSRGRCAATRAGRRPRGSRGRDCNPAGSVRPGQDGRVCGDDAGRPRSRSAETCVRSSHPSPGPLPVEGRGRRRGVASMTESEPDVQSERISHHALG